MKYVALVLILLDPLSVFAADLPSVEGRKLIADAVVCRGEPSQALDGFIAEGGSYTPEFAAMGFGEGTSYKSVVVLKEPLQVGDARARTFVSETESSNFEFSAFTYGDFEGDPVAVAAMLDLTEASEADKERGHFQRALDDGSACPPTIMLTPLENGRFLLGCGWCNGG